VRKNQREWRFDSALFKTGLLLENAVLAVNKRREIFLAKRRLVLWILLKGRTQKFSEKSRGHLLIRFSAALENLSI
jgi:hypothetical protein